MEIPFLTPVGNRAIPTLGECINSAFRNIGVTTDKVSNICRREGQPCAGQNRVNHAEEVVTSGLAYLSPFLLNIELIDDFNHVLSICVIVQHHLVADSVNSKHVGIAGDGSQATRSKVESHTTVSSGSKVNTTLQSASHADNRNHSTHLVSQGVARLGAGIQM